MTAHNESYTFPSIPSQKELDEYKVPFHSRDRCAAHMINYYKCLDKGTSFCFDAKEEFYKCQYIALKQRLEGHKA